MGAECDQGDGDKEIDGEGGAHRAVREGASEEVGIADHGVIEESDDHGEGNAEVGGVTEPSIMPSGAEGEGGALDFDVASSGQILVGEGDGEAEIDLVALADPGVIFDF